MQCTTPRRRRLRLALLLALHLVFGAAAGLAQSTTPPWMFHTDSLYSVLSGDSAYDAGEPSQGYLFVMPYDSCHVDYLITECRRNGRLLRLLHWQEGRDVHAPAEYLTLNSRTAAFPVRPGDTISFYRELSWYHPTTRFMGTTNYVASDTLEWIAHLVRASDGMPIGQIDSTGIFPNTKPGPPRMHGSRPIMAVARYIVPSTILADSAFIGFTVRANGSGASHFVRVDEETFSVSQRLTDAWYVNFLNHYSPAALSKRTMSDFAEHRDDRYNLVVQAQADRAVAISFDVPEGEDGGIAVAVYDAAGRQVYAPSASPRRLAGRGEAAYRFQQSGLYFVALVAGDRIVRSQSITIN